jgi:hypothetical protein
MLYGCLFALYDRLKKFKKAFLNLRKSLKKKKAGIAQLAERQPSKL